MDPGLGGNDDQSDQLEKSTFLDILDSDVFVMLCVGSSRFQWLALKLCSRPC